MTAPSDPRDRLVTGGAVAVGVRDHGGTGAPVLLLHGAGADRTAWDAVASEMVPAHRVVAVDLRDDLASLDRVGAPFLVVVAECDPSGLPAEWAPMMRAFRAGLRRDVGARARTDPHLALLGIEATHGMIAERPEEVAVLVERFLAAHRTPPPA